MNANNPDAESLALIARGYTEIRPPNYTNHFARYYHKTPDGKYQIDFEDHINGSPYAVLLDYIIKDTAANRKILKKYQGIVDTYRYTDEGEGYPFLSNFNTVDAALDALELFIKQDLTNVGDQNENH